METSYKHCYSEFKDSNWFTYWETEIEPSLSRQKLMAWFITDDCVYIQYSKLLELMEEDTLVDILPFKGKLSEDDQNALKRSCRDFISDVQNNFRKN